MPPLVSRVLILLTAAYAKTAREELHVNLTMSEPETAPKTEHREGRVARGIEQQTARIPSDTFLWAALGSIALSLGLELAGQEKKAQFVGHWAPTFLLLGVYNKMVKLMGSDGR